MGLTGAQKRCCQGIKGLVPNEAYEYRAYCLIKPLDTTMMGWRKEDDMC